MTQYHKTEAYTLRQVNRAIIVLGGILLDSMPKGVQESAVDCPFARSFATCLPQPVHVGYKAINLCDRGDAVAVSQAWGVNPQRIVEVTLTNEDRVSYEVPISRRLKSFITLFDRGELPHLIDTGEYSVTSDSVIISNDAEGLPAGGGECIDAASCSALLDTNQSDEAYFEKLEATFA